MAGRKGLAAAVRWISHSANGHYYPLVPMIVFWVRPERAAVFLTAALAAFALELPLYKLIKNGIKRNRPFEVLAGVQRRIIPSDQFSFPSGHTAAAVVMATLIAAHFPFLALPAFAWALSVGFSRVFLGVHYPTDILAGIAIGLLCGWSGLVIAG
jgi:undecaprenyl-diphosphatase